MSIVSAAGQHGPGDTRQFVGDRHYDLVAWSTLRQSMHPLPESSGVVLDAEQYRASERKTAVDAFLRATIQAVPGARKTSMNAHTLPSYVLGLVKDKGHPLQLVNAFENPVRPKNGLMEASIAALKEHHQQLKATWGIKPLLEITIPDKPLDDFCKEILNHV